jgi:glutamyl-tRNA reductase
MSAAQQPQERAASRPVDPARLIVVGVSYRSAAVGVRERVAVASEERESVLRELCDGRHVHEAMVV